MSTREIVEVNGKKVEVIKAEEFFAKKGQGMFGSGRVKLGRELLFGAALGLTLGFVWKTYHWNYSRQIEQYYYDLDKIRKAKAAESAE